MVIDRRSFVSSPTSGRLLGAVMPFPPVSLRFPSGTILVVPLSQSNTYKASDFTPLHNLTDYYHVWFDFGNGIMAEVEHPAGGSPEPTITMSYEAVGVFTLRLLLQQGGDHTGGGFVERHSWQLQVAVPAENLTPGGPVPYIAAAHATFSLPVGRRHAIQLLMAASNGGSHDVTAAPPLTRAQFVNALEVLGRHLQQWFAVGFGRMPPPTESEQRAVHTHMEMDSLVYGTSAQLLSDLSAIERQLADAEQDPSRADSIAILQNSLFSMSSTANLLSFGRVNTVGGNILIPGARTTGFMEVWNWGRFATSAVDERQKLSDVSLQTWRVFEGVRDTKAPVYDRGTAWRWEVIQALAEVFVSFYAEIGGIAHTGADQFAVLFLAVPESGACSLRICDRRLGFWVEATVAPGYDGDHLELADMLDDGGTAARPGGNFAVARVAGICNTTASPGSPPVDPATREIPYAFDVMHVQRALDGTLQADVPAVQTLTGLTTLRDVAGTDLARNLRGDGMSIVSAEGANAVAATIGLVALPMQDGRDAWASLRPHALYEVLGGVMPAFERRG